MGLSMSSAVDVDVIFVGVAEVECPACEQRTRVTVADYRGAQIQCSGCGVIMTILDDVDFELSAEGCNETLKEDL